MNKPILCVDFDGVIHSYTSGWKGEEVVFDPPVKGALEWLWKATEFWSVAIYSSRSKTEGGRHAMADWLGRNAALELGDAHPMAFTRREDYPIVFAHEKPPAFLTIDDRAICFEGYWQDLDPEKLLEFKPWNKRELGASGTFPQGRINDDDEGELNVGVGYVGVGYDALDGIVRIEFGKPVTWLGLPPPNAVEFAKAILRKAGAKKITVEI